MSSRRESRWVLLVLMAGAAGCGEPAAALVPIVEVPSAESDAYPYAAIDTWELSVARAGDEEPIALVSDSIDEELSLDDVAYGGDLVVHLSGRSGGSELAYGRTCSFDFERGDRAEPRLFFSRIVRWAAGPALSNAHSGPMLGVSMTSDGLGLFWDREAGGTVEVIDAVNVNGDGSAQLLEAVLASRSGATATTFGGRVLVVGGKDGNGDAAGIVEQVLPTESNAGNQVLETSGPSVIEHESIELVDGSVLVTGGRTQPGAGEAFVHSDSATLFSLLGDELVERDIEPGLSVPRTRHSMTRLGNDVGADILIIGGLDASGQAIAQAELYRPLGNAFESIASAILGIPRLDHAAVRLPGGFVLVVGGYSTQPGGELVAVRELELYDPVQGVFLPAGTLPSSSGVVGMSVTELPDGRFLIAGGEDIDGEPVSSALIARFDPIAGVVDLSPTAPLAQARSHHAAIQLCDGTVLLSGGTAAPSTDTERYNPPSTDRR